MPNVPDALLLPSLTTTNRGDNKMSLKPAAPDRSDEEYVVNRLVDHYFDEDGTLLFRVRWEGYSAKDVTWEPAHHITHNTVLRYCRRHGLPMLMCGGNTSIPHPFEWVHFI